MPVQVVQGTARSIKCMMQRIVENPYYGLPDLNAEFPVVRQGERRINRTKGQMLECGEGELNKFGL